MCYLTVRSSLLFRLLVIVLVSHGSSGNRSCIGQVPLESPSPNRVASVPSISKHHDLLLNSNVTNAGLNSVAVVTPDHVCAVGDAGAIVRSNNGGRTWSHVESPTRVNLNSIIFFDTQQGLAAGGTIGSHTRTSEGVLLQTQDGGETWTEIVTNVPRVLGLKLDGARLIAWGDYCPERRSGVFISQDRGVTWTSAQIPLSHVTAAGARQGRFVAMDTLNRYYAGQPNPRDFRSVLQHANRWKAIRHTGQSWIACGGNGTLEISNDGIHWTQVKVPLSQGAQRNCHWESIAQSGSELWIAGCPGSLFLYSPDFGQTWEVRYTGVSTPIHDIVFFDSQRGWAVGPLGKILATRDGGQSWYAQRRGSARLAVLAASESSASIPWAPLAASTWEERRLAAAIVLGTEDPIDEAGFLPSPTTQLQVLAPQLGLTVQVQTGFELQEAAHRQNQLVAALLTWQPDVLLVGTSDGNSSSGPIRLHGFVESAIRQASLVDAPIPWVQELGLNAWHVQKLVSVTDSRTADFSEQNQRVLKSLGLAIWDLLLPLPPEVVEQSTSTAMRTWWSETLNQAARTSLLGGIARDVSTERDSPELEVGNFQLVMGRVHRHNSIAQLVDTDSAEEKWVRDLDFLLMNLPASEYQPVLWKLAQDLDDAKLATKRRHVLLRLIGLQKTGDGPRWAMLELLRLSASDEVAAWHQSDSTRDEPRHLASANDPPSSDDPGSALSAPSWNASPFEQYPNAMQTTAVVSASASKEDTRQPTAIDATQWFQLYSEFSQLAPDLIHRPDIQMLAHRMSSRMPGQAHFSDRLETLQEMKQIIGWPQIAQQELAYRSNQLRGSRWVAFAPWAETRPQLDGQLDERFWNRVPPMPMTDFADQQEPSLVRWAYDQRYLYIAIQCPKPEGSARVPVQRIRTYDSDLSAQDHVELVLDTDRDYVSTIQLAIGEDGRTYDRCCGQQKFDPKWHVFVDSSAASWTAEIAVDLRYLTTDKNLVAGAWAVSARRLGGTAPQSWSRLRTHRPMPAASGMLLFLPKHESVLAE